MASLRWIGGAPTQAQITSWTFGGTWIVGENITITIGTKTWTYTIASATIATFLDAMVTAYNALSASTYPEYAEMIASRSSSTFKLTADTAGVPFVAAFSTDSASGTIGSATATQDNQGPYDWNTGANWTGGAVPADTDTVDLADDGEIRYGLDQSSNGFTGRCGTTKIGLPHINTSGSTSYPEYRQAYLKTKGGTWTVGTGNPAAGQSAGPARFKIQFVTSGGTLIVKDYGTNGRDYQNVEPILCVGLVTTASLTRAEIGFAVFGGESCTLTTLNQSYRTNPGGDVQTRCGTGCAITTINKEGGKLVVENPASITLNNVGGETTLNGTGGPSQITITGGVVIYNTSGTLGGATVVANGGLLDFDQDPRAKTVSAAIDCYSGGQVRDSFRAVSSLVIDFNYMAVGAWGSNIRLTRGNVA